jgi:hypothetical protein
MVENWKLRRKRRRRKHSYGDKKVVLKLRIDRVEVQKREQMDQT